MLEKIRRIKASMTEGLKGDQHQLDHDKDGKIEGEDLAKLRKKMKKEEAEQLDELSKETLGSYKHKAELSIPKDDRAYANRSKGIDKAEKKLKKEEKFNPLKHVKNPTPGEKKAAKDVKRSSYADRAAMLRSAQNDGRLKESAHPFDEFSPEQLEEFMQTEDYQQLDELSKKTLGSYVKKASRERGFSGLEAGASASGSSQQKDAVKTMKKRQTGVIKATDRLTKEAAQYPRATHTDVKDVAANRAPAEQQHAALHKVTVKSGIPSKHEDGADKVKGAAKAQPTPKKNYVEDPLLNKDIYIQSFKTYVQMKGDLERM